MSNWTDAERRALEEATGSCYAPSEETRTKTGALQLFRAAGGNQAGPQTVQPLGPAPVAPSSWPAVHGAGGVRELLVRAKTAALRSQVPELGDVLDDAAALTEWRQVPLRVSGIYKEAADTARKIRKVIKHLDAMPGYGYVFWHPEDKTAWVVLGDSDDQNVHNRWHNALKGTNGVDKVISEAETHPPNPDDWVMIKTSQSHPYGLVAQPFVAVGKTAGYRQMANAIISGLLSGGGSCIAAYMFPEKQAADPGYSPLTHSALGALVGGGLGYGGGALLENLFPRRYLKKGKIRKMLGLAGAGLGAMPGIYGASLNKRMAAGGDKPLSWLGAMTTPAGNVTESLDSLRRRQSYNISSGLTPGGKVVQSSAFEEKVAEIIEDFIKVAAFDQPFQAGAGLRPIPMDAFNNAIWNDVGNYAAASRNPHGTKSPWGDNDQPLHTPPQLGAATAGLVSGIQSMYKGQSVLSPKHFVNGLMAATGDLVTARLIGGTLGALGGLTPLAQEKIQDMGLWGGLLRGTVGSMMGMR